MRRQNNSLLIPLIFSVLAGIGCQAGTLNIGDVGTSENPLEKSGELAQSEIWAGKILITGDIIVPEGMTLTIRSDSVVGFDPTTGVHQLVVHGVLYAEGEPKRLITFGSLGSDAEGPEAGDWVGIRLETTSLNSRLAYCRIQHADTAISCGSDTVQIERCLLSDNKLSIFCDNASPLINENEINKNGTAIKCLKGASPEITRNVIQANEFGIVCDDDSRPMIDHNELSSNYQHAIVCYASASPEITFNNIVSNGGWAVYDGGRLRENFIRGNKEQGPEVVDRGTGRDGGQFYGVDEVLDPRAAPVPDAGVPQER
ncbi:MAG: right-handed parallel beta-helix repeat-containing protein [Candidatus Poribacteria bacterium]|nr:right-handed parallel beta-helix repeat-containing protein [Candidatus Poribacteria bacterium]